jgi:hypothetical protein
MPDNYGISASTKRQAPPAARMDVGAGKEFRLAKEMSTNHEVIDLVESDDDIEKKKRTKQVQV